MSETPHKEVWPRPGSLLSIAHRHLGICEVGGADSHPLIRRWILDSADWLNPDDSMTAWCAVAMRDWMLEFGAKVPLTATYRARSYLDVGMEVLEEDRHRLVATGNVLAVFSRRRGAHVAVVESIEGNAINVIGGNQRDCVTRAPYSDAVLLGLRYVVRDAIPVSRRSPSPMLAII